jgi:hypothetical protein
VISRLFSCIGSEHSGGFGIYTLGYAFDKQLAYLDSVQIYEVAEDNIWLLQAETVQLEASNLQ